GFVSEVENQADTFVRQSEIRQKLLLVNRGGLLAGLELQDDKALDDHVGAEAEFEANAFPDHGNRYLAVDAQPALRQFMGHDGAVNGFEKTGAESAVDVDGGVDDLAGDVVVGH